MTVVALGDSLTAGYGLSDQSQGFVPVLEAWLKARGHEVVVQNAGVSGDTTAGGLARVDCFYTEDRRVIINEINTMPGFTPHSMYPRMWAETGVPYDELVDELITLALERRVGLR